MKYQCDKYIVKAKTPEKAAKKIYRMNKNKYYALGYIDLKCQEGFIWRFRCSNWLRKGSKMFKK